MFYELLFILGRKHMSSMGNNEKRLHVASSATPSYTWFSPCFDKSDGSRGKMSYAGKI